MPRPNAIKQIGFPESVNQGLEIVVCSRIDKYLAEHPKATEAEAYQAAKASLTSAATALRIDAVVEGKERHLNVIAALPTDTQMAMGNHALALEFLDAGDGHPTEFGDRAIAAWVEACLEELYDAVYAYFQTKM
ncbi:MAG: hypothetical protein WA949_12605 [Phormidesmis sp.]